MIIIAGSVAADMVLEKELSLLGLRGQDPRYHGREGSGGCSRVLSPYLSPSS